MRKSYMKVKKMDLPAGYVNLWNYYNPSMPFFIGMTGRSDHTRNEISAPVERANFQALAVVFLRQGKGTVTVNGRSFAVKKGDVFFLPKNRSHSYTTDKSDPWIADWFVAEGELAHKMLELYLPKNCYLVENFNAEYLFSGIRDLYDSYCDKIELFVKYTTLLYCSFVVDINTFLSGDSDNVAYKVKYYIDYNSHENVSVKTVADKLHYSVNYIIRSFKKEFGMTPAQYYIKRKIELAEMYLRTNDETISEISDKLHFVDQHYFANAFKRQTGMTPSRYRAQFKNN